MIVGSTLSLVGSGRQSIAPATNGSQRVGGCKPVLTCSLTVTCRPEIEPKVAKKHKRKSSILIQISLTKSDYIRVRHGEIPRGASRKVSPRGIDPPAPPLFRALDYIQINKFASRGPHVAHHSVYSCPQKHSGKIIKSEVSSNFHRKCLCWGLTWTETCFYFHRLAYISNEQRSPKFFIRGQHKLLHKRPRPDILSNVFFFRYDTFYQTSKVFRQYTIFSLLTKCLRGPDKMASQAGFGPPAVVWRPLH